MEQKIRGVIISTKEHNESDKLALCFSYERGLINIKFRGVKKENAKMKAVCQPFVFAEFILASNKDYATVISYEVIQNFDISDFYKSNCAFIILDLIKNVLPLEEADENVFLRLVKALNDLETDNFYRVVVDFILDFFKLQGVGLDLDLEGDVYLDKYSGNFIDLPDGNCIKLDSELYNSLSKSELTIDEFKQILKLLGNIIYLKFDMVLKSIKCFLEL